MEKEQNQISGGKIENEDSNARKTYKVKKGDTLAGIALAHGVSQATLQRANHIITSNIYPGQNLYIPTATLFSKPIPVPDKVVVNTSRSNSSNSSRSPASTSGKSISPTSMLPLSPISSPSNKKARTSPTSMQIDQAFYIIGNKSIYGTFIATSSIVIFEPSTTANNEEIRSEIHLYQVAIDIMDLVDVTTVESFETPPNAATNLDETTGSPPNSYSGTVTNYIQIFYLDSNENMGKVIYFCVEDDIRDHLVQQMKHWATQAQMEASNPKSRGKEEPSFFISPDTSKFEFDYPKLKESSSIITSDIVRDFYNHLPVRCRQDWKLVYSLEKNGSSFNTFYLKTKGKGPTVMIIEDSKGNVFGAFITESWRISDKYYGSGESFLFTIKPRLQFFKWTQKNSFFVFSGTQSISVGEGMGLWVDADFLQGSSSECATFGNDPLTGNKELFHIVRVEVWGVS